MKPTFVVASRNDPGGPVFTTLTIGGQPVRVMNLGVFQRATEAANRVLRALDRTV